MKFANPDIKVVHVETGDIHTITQTPTIREWFGVWSTDGSRIAIVTSYQDSNWDVVVVNIDGSSLHPLNLSGFLGILQVQWSPNDENLALYAARNLDDYFALHIIQDRELTHLPIVPGWSGFAWSPDGRQLAYTALLRSTVEVYDIFTGDWGYDLCYEKGNSANIV